MTKRSIALGLILAVVIAAAACAKDESQDLLRESNSAPEVGAQADSSKKSERSGSLLQAGSSTSDGGGGEGGDAPSRAPAGLGAAGPVPAAQPALPNIPPATSKVIKNANLEIRVKKGSFDREFGRATAVAEQFGGFVSHSSVTETDRNISSGTLTVRVPSNQFQAALRRFQGLGKVTNEEQSGQDVTKEFVDLEARLRHAKTEEAFFLRLLDQSRSISDMIQVQSQLSAVQLRIEEIQGQQLPERPDILFDDHGTDLRAWRPCRRPAHKARQGLAGGDPGVSVGGGRVRSRRGMVGAVRPVRPDCLRGLSGGQAVPGANRCQQGGFSRFVTQRNS